MTDSGVMAEKVKVMVSVVVAHRSEDQTKIVVAIERLSDWGGLGTSA
jgi:hypothetical protein